MSTDTLERPDLLEDVDLEELWDEDIPCDYSRRSGCENKATWRAITQTCGHRYHVCTQHRGKMLASFASKKDEWVCSKSGQPITHIDWEPL